VFRKYGELESRTRGGRRNVALPERPIGPGRMDVQRAAHRVPAREDAQPKRRRRSCQEDERSEKEQERRDGGNQSTE
jgi:hypothetical protein